MLSKLHVAPIGPTNASQASDALVADYAGMAASIACAIHCAAMPLVFAYLPTLGLGWLAGEAFHRWMAVLCFILAAAAFFPGWKTHRSLLPMIWGAAGLVLLNTAAFGLEGSCCPSCDACSPNASSANFAGLPIPFVTPLGGLLLVVGHVLNHRKRCRGTNCCHKAAADAQ